PRHTDRLRHRLRDRSRVPRDRGATTGPGSSYRPRLPHRRRRYTRLMAATAQQDAKNDRIVWIDCEMTGLEESDVLVEIAALVTDAELNVLGEGIDVVIHATDDELGRMVPFVRDMHQSSGLTELIRESEVSV